MTAFELVLRCRLLHRQWLAAPAGTISAWLLRLELSLTQRALARRVAGGGQ
ncbi:MAG: hypothetical protein AAGJ95_13995 [Cyanobacteria bacterium J06554_11]